MRKNLIWVAGVSLFAVILSGGCSSTPKPGATPEDQMAALGGLDIPLGPLGEGIVFGEPMPEDALVLKPIYFDFDKSEIREDNLPILEGIAAWMMEKPEARLKIEGHCDERGTKEYNLALGERRALSVRSHLTGLAVNPERIFTISYGEEDPVCLEASEECWAQNRRAEFLVNYGGEETVGGEEPLAPGEAVVMFEETEVIEEVVEAPQENTASSGPRERSIDRYYR